MELAYLAGKGYGRHRSDLFKKVEGIASVANIPEIQVQSELINKILHTNYVDDAGIDEFEHIRVSLRNLMKYLPKNNTIKYDTNFTDEILSTEWNESELENDELENYKAKAEFYVRQHQDNIANTMQMMVILKGYLQSIMLSKNWKKRVMLKQKEKISGQNLKVYI